MAVDPIDHARQQTDAIEARLLADYQAVFSRVAAQLDAVAARIIRAQRQGVKIDEGWLLEQGRLRSALAVLEQEMARVSRVSAQRIHAGAVAAGGAGGNYAGGLIGVGRASERATRIVASVQHLERVLGGLTPEASLRLRRALIEGLVLGKNPKVVARTAARTLGVSYTRAVTVARTEILGAYRQAAIETYRENADVVQAVTWVSALDRRTCPVCWGLHGETFDLDDAQAIATHPACRCTLIPVTNDRLSVKSGPDVFDSLPASEQRFILGPGKFALYQDGVPLKDMGKVVQTPLGLGRQQVPLRDLRNLAVVTTNGQFGS